MDDLSTKIVIEATDQTKAAFASAQAGISSLASSIKALPGFSGIAASLAAFAGAGAITKLIGETIEWAASMDDLAERTGASVENLSSLAAQAKISGTDMGVVEQGIVKLNKALAGADDESKGAAHALSAIGLNIGDLRAKDPAEAFRAIAEALGQFADGGGKTALVMDVMGKNAAQLLPYMKDLAESGKLNAKISAEQAAAAEQLEKAWNKTSAEGGSFAKMMVIDMMPTLASLLDFLNLTKMGISELTSFFVVGANEIATAAQIMWTAVFAKSPEERKSKIDSLLDQRKNFLSAAAEEMTAYALKYQSLRDKIDKILEGGDEKKPRLKYQSASTKDAAPKSEKSSAFDSFLADLDRMIAKMNEGEYAALRLKAAQLATKEGRDPSAAFPKIEAYQRAMEADKVDAFAESLKKLNRQYEEQADTVGMSAREIESLTIARRNNESAEAAILAAEKAHAAFSAEAQSQIRKDAEASTKAILTSIEQRRDAESRWENGAKRALSSYSDEVSNVAMRTETAITNSFRGMEDALTKFYETGKFQISDLSNVLQHEAAKWAAQQTMKPLAVAGSSVMSDIANLFSGSFFANGGIMTSSGPLPLKRYAGGGIASSPQLAMFGEGSMPEAYVPLPDGRAIPVQMRGSGQSAPNVTVNVINQSGQSLSAKSQGRPQFNGEAWVLGVIVDAMETQPKFRAAMGR